MPNPKLLYKIIIDSISDKNMKKYMAEHIEKNLDQYNKFSKHGYAITDHSIEDFPFNNANNSAFSTDQLVKHMKKALMPRGINVSVSHGDPTQSFYSSDIPSIIFSKNKIDNIDEFMAPYYSKQNSEDISEYMKRLKDDGSFSREELPPLSNKQIEHQKKGELLYKKYQQYAKKYGEDHKNTERVYDEYFNHSNNFPYFDE